MTLASECREAPQKQPCRGALDPASDDLASVASGTRTGQAAIFSAQDSKHALASGHPGFRVESLVVVAVEPSWHSSPSFPPGWLAGTSSETSLMSCICAEQTATSVVISR